MKSTYFSAESYQPLASLLTDGEKEYFPLLQKIILERKMLLFAKVRLADIFKVKEGVINTYKAKNPDIEWFDIPPLCKIMSRHVDFLVCDDAYRPRLMIELDREDRSKKETTRDKEIDAIAVKCGISIIHIQYKMLCDWDKDNRTEEELNLHIDRQLKGTSDPSYVSAFPSSKPTKVTRGDE